MVNKRENIFTLIFLKKIFKGVYKIDKSRLNYLLPQTWILLFNENILNKYDWYC